VLEGFDEVEEVLVEEEAGLEEEEAGLEEETGLTCVVGLLVEPPQVNTAGPGIWYVVYEPYKLKRMPGSVAE
jgi:hypothetical protein